MEGAMWTSDYPSWQVLRRTSEATALHSSLMEIFLFLFFIFFFFLLLISPDVSCSSLLS